MSDQLKPPLPHYYTLSEEHRRQVRRFQGRKYDPEEDRRSLSLWQWGWWKHSPDVQHLRDARAAGLCRQSIQEEEPSEPVGA